MGMGWHEWPLMIFTVLGQTVVGAFAVMAIALLNGRLEASTARRAQLAMFFLWVLMGLAFIASVIHLGSPLRAFNSLNRVGDSALSNEIASGAVFFALGGIYWLLALFDKLSQGVGKAWLLVTLAAGLVFVYAMCRVYAISTVPTWDSSYTSLHFVLTALIAGPLLGYLLLDRSGVQSWALRILPTLSVAAFLVSCGVVLLQTPALATIASSVQQASALIPAYGQLSLWRFVLLALGLGCWLCPLVRGRRPALFSLLLALVLVLSGELIGRALFYGLHMTVGVTYGG